MPSPIPTSYDWSKTSAPTGSFGVEAIPGSQSVLENLTGRGALSTGARSGSSGGSNIFNLQNLTRLAGAVGSLFGEEFSIEESTKKLQEEADKVRQEIDERFSNIYPALTGMTGPEAMDKYYDMFAKTTEKVYDQGRADLMGDPDITKQYGGLQNRVEELQQGNLNLANLVGGFEALAKDPPVVSLDPAKIKSAGAWSAPEIASQYNQFMDYSGPQTSDFIGGVQKRTADAIGRYLSGSSDVAGLMSYSAQGLS